MTTIKLNIIITIRNLILSIRKNEYHQQTEHILMENISVFVKKRFE